MRKRIAVLLPLLAAAMHVGVSQATTFDADAIGSGTGFFINTDGWLVTNAHVQENCNRVTLAGGVEVTDWKVDAENDLAVGHVAGSAGPIAIRRSPVRLGEDVAALGYPLATVLSSSIKITTGNVNSLLGLADDTRYLQISTPIQPGNSGGPLVDQSGALLGITTGILKDSAGDNSVAHQNVNFAIRASVLALFLESRGVAYQSVDAIGPVLGTADLAEKTAPSVVQLICHGTVPSPPVTSNESNQPATVVPVPNGRSFTHLENRDVIGFDYRTLPRVSRTECIAACDADWSCKAVTYNRRQHFCFLKNDAALTVWNQDSQASILSALSSSIFQSDFVIYSGRDQPGGDYLQIRHTSFLNCFLACAKDTQCRAFSFIRKKDSCWLKNISGRIAKQAGVDLGVK